MGKSYEGDRWVGKSGERISMTIEEKAITVARSIRGVVSLARDTQQSDMRVQAMREQQSRESLLDIDPTDVQRIMGDISTEELDSNVAILAGEAEATAFLSQLKSHTDLNPSDRKMLYLRVLSAMVAAIQGEDASSLGQKN
jgi:Zn-dependent M16 (insulinase) family peptidase